MIPFVTFTCKFNNNTDEKRHMPGYQIYHKFGVIIANIHRRFLGLGRILRTLLILVYLDNMINKELIR